MRVLHVLTTPNRRGAESGALALSVALCGRGVDTAVVALTTGGEGPLLDVPVIGGPSLSPRTLWRLRARAARADVVVAHGSRTLSASALSLAGTRVPFVYKNIGDTAYWSASPARRLRVGAALRRAEAVVALTDRAKRSLHDHHGLPDLSVVVIPSWRSGERFPPVTPQRRAAARTELGVPEEGRVYLVMGALAAEKRVDLAVAAVAPIAGSRLVVVGDGPQRSWLEAEAAARMPGRVVFTGVVDEPEKMLAAADVVLLTSESEGVPGVLIEAGLTCLPVVAFDVGGVSSVVDHGRTGLLVPPGDVAAMTAACETVLTDAQDMGRRARERCLQEFDTDLVVDRWLALLRRVVTAPTEAQESGNR